MNVNEAFLLLQTFHRLAARSPWPLPGRSSSGLHSIEKVVARQKPLAGSRVAARQIASYIRGVGTRA